jgi:polyisoprenoid-binding protein YceI
MSTPVSSSSDRAPDRGAFLQRHWKKLVGGVVALVVLVLAASFIYAKVLNDAPDELDSGDLSDALNDTTPATAPGASVTTTAAAATSVPATRAPAATTAAPTPSSDAPASTAEAAATTSPADGGATTAPAATTAASTSVDGVWNVTQASTLRYRVTESINGFDTEGVGETNQITGTLTLAGSSATAAGFTVDMATFTSNESRRDGQFNGRIMSVDEFPTSSFVLTSAIEFGTVPSDGETITATATGDLTLRGVTKSVTFDLTASLQNGRVGVLGNIPVLFADYGIPNPSFGTISTEDNGLLEFVLVFERA